MNSLAIILLKSLRKGYKKVSLSTTYSNVECNNNPESVSGRIFDILISKQPCMIARFGNTEMNCLCNYIGISKQKNKFFDFIKGESNPWWWESKIINQMEKWSGFFPPTIEKIEQYCNLMIQDIPQVDILGSWLPGEKYFEKELANSHKAALRLLEPFWSKNHWTKALEGKKVLVVHPFENSIKRQYKRKDLLFKNNILPEFELKTLKAVVSFADSKTEFRDWFEALEYMKCEIDKIDYDICLIGAGAYGFHLAAHVKRMGKKSFHIGGVLQLLFGIRGKRWDDPNYGVKEWNIPIGSYTSLINDYWIRPDIAESPTGASNVEEGCYW